jgi:hypothetical protein
MKPATSFLILLSPVNRSLKLENPEPGELSVMQPEQLNGRQNQALIPAALIYVMTREVNYGSL